MNVVIGAKTDPGRRTNNEDQLGVVDVQRHGLRADGVLVIADGMGGRSLGEKASAAAVETVQDTLVEMLAAGRAEADTGEALVSALRKANARVYEMSRRDEEGKGMGTTCVAAVVQGFTLHVAHAGDSRAYLLRDGRMERLTDDHSYVAEQVRAGAISEEGARSSRFRNVITRAVGIEPTIVPDVARHDVQPGDNLLLCTDGLTNVVPEDEIAQTLQYAPSPQAAAERLIQLANRGGGKDNITALVARLEVGNRTEQMRAEDLPKLPAGRRSQPMRLRDLLPSRADFRAGASTENGSGGHTDAGRAEDVWRQWLLWPILGIVGIVALLGVVGYLGHILAQDGYSFRALPPFVVRPAAASRQSFPATAVLANLSYAPPANFFVKPVQGGLLSLNNVDGSLTVITQSGQVVILAHDGAILAQFRPKKVTPKKGAPKPITPAAAPPVFAADGNQYAAADRQGNLYVSNPAQGQIAKYAPDMTSLGQIPGLDHPAALAIAGDGTIYVIDDERLKVIRPTQSP